MNVPQQVYARSQKNIRERKPKAKYELHFDFGEMREKLAEIEKGNPQRMLKFNSLHSAIASVNITRMALGLAMVRGPRALAEHSSVVFATEGMVRMHLVRR